MSYCRWSSNDFDCDLYIYESDAGFQVRVASGRHDIDRSLLPPPVSYADDPGGWFARGTAVTELVRGATVVPIGLPHDGESHTFDTAGECADFVERLAAVGYHVPADVVDALREDDQP